MSFFNEIHGISSAFKIYCNCAIAAHAQNKSTHIKFKGIENKLGCIDEWARPCFIKEEDI